MNLPEIKDLIDKLKNAEVSREAIPALLVGLAALQSSLALRLLEPTHDKNQVEGDKLLSIKEAAGRLMVSQDWLYRRADRLNFTVRLGRQLRFSSSGIDTYIRQHKGRTSSKLT